jgi:hypothetical protein
MPQLVKGGKYVYGWTTINTDGRIRMPDEAFDEKSFWPSNELIDSFELQIGNKLLVGRGSGLGPAFMARGRIYDEALKHKNLHEYH